MCSDIAIRATNLGKTYRMYAHPMARLRQMILPGGKKHYKEFHALQDVNFEIRKGETVGIIGRNGSGKSTLLQLICGILKPTSGSVEVTGRVSALLELGAGFHPEFTGRENVYMQGAIQGLTRQEMDARFDDIAAFADIGDFIERPVKTYSSGMFVRLAFSVAVHVEPDILVVDEALAVGDVDFQTKCLLRMRSLMDSGATVLFVTHNIATLGANCSRAFLMDHGRIVANTSASDAVDRYRCDVLGSAQVDLTAPGLHRRGQTQFAKLLRLELFDCNGLPSNRFAMGDRLRIRLRLHCQLPLPAARCGILLTNSADVLIHDMASGFAGLEGFSEGEHLFELETEPLMIYPGKYFLGAWVQQALGIPSDDYVRAALAFAVVDHQQVGAPQARFGDLVRANTEVYLPCRWTKSSDCVATLQECHPCA
jgi:ABC-type polysaccharide/polyol phosphate transport system ATPase subunit